MAFEHRTDTHNLVARTLLLMLHGSGITNRGHWTPYHVEEACKALNITPVCDFIEYLTKLV